MADFPLPINFEQSYGHRFQLFNRTIHAEVTKSHEFVERWLQPLIDVVEEFVMTKGWPYKVGFGVEFTDGGVATVHLCYNDKCLIYHMSGEESFPLSLKQFLFNPLCAFVGFGLQKPQLDILKRDAGFDNDVKYECLHDSERYVSKEDMRLLSTVVLQNLDVVRPQPDGRWDLQKLSNKQIEYASIGAYVFHKIGMLMWRVRGGCAPPRSRFRVNEVEDVIEHVHEVQVFDKTIITTVTKRLIAVENWITDILRDGHLYDYVGFDVQIHNKDNKPQLATVQFCVDTRCLIIQLENMNGRYLPQLEHFLLRGKNTFVGVDVIPKMGMLKDVLYFEKGARLKVIDLGVNVAIAHGRRDLRFAFQDRLARELFGANLERPPDVENDWFRPLLSDAQVKYACIDAAASYEIRKRLLARR